MAKRIPLVCQHLEKISRSALEKYQDSIREFVRKRHGVYALYRRGRLYYVGLASNLRNRLRGHLKGRHAKQWDSFSVYLTIGDSHIKELESLILRITDPPGNKQAGKFAKSEDLRRRLGQKIRQRMQREYFELMGRADAGEEGNSRHLRVVPKGQRPVMARYIQSPLKLRSKWRGKTYHARVRRDGSISYKGKIYNSPSLAGLTVVGHACNGWTFWKYERAPGDWVPLNTLKK